MEYAQARWVKVGVEEFRRNAPAILARVEGGFATVILTKSGRSVAKIVPPGPRIGPPEAEPRGDLAAALQETAKEFGVSLSDLLAHGLYFGWDSLRPDLDLDSPDGAGD